LGVLAKLNADRVAAHGDKKTTKEFVKQYQKIAGVELGSKGINDFLREVGSF
jgi:hypothetical protein